ncbi:MAG TPA: UDP-N-acetylglucosamine 2-epimerase (non-hydrolyzing) [Allosphingosinicella sp.]|jgi:UDP-N-acetylglucosamine 2-epimerase (non-hydrolysing)
MKLLAVIGTRPEAVKMAPLLLALRAEPAVDLRLCLSGQHRELIDPVLQLFGLEADVDLALMTSGQSLNTLTGRALERLDVVLQDIGPDRVLVHGDTTTALAAALAAFHRGIPVAHVEAGLRTYDPARPFPEEMNRRAVDLIADLLFAPTARARRNLEAERVSGTVFVTGNSGIDALELTLRRLEADETLRAAAEAELPELGKGRRLLLVTGHRRESFGEGLRGVCAALVEIAQRGDVEIVYPVHLNPQVKGPVEAALGGADNIRLLPPLGYPAMVRLMQRADLILTDSGGIQEEAPTLGKPVLVTRAATERPEAVEAGMARLVGTDAGAIVAAAAEVLDAGAASAGFRNGPNPYGDGKAGERIAAALLGRPSEEFGAA